MREINLVLQRVEEMGGSWKYQQETPSRSELDIFSNLYLDKQALGNRRAPFRLSVTLRPDGDAPSASRAQNRNPRREIDVIVRLCEKSEWTVHYKQKQPDLQVHRIITDPYVGIRAFDNQPPPDLLRITVHFDRE